MVARRGRAKANGATAKKVVEEVLEVQEEEMEEMDEIELSSDEEDDQDDDVALIVLKRPPVTERVVQEVEITEDIEITGSGGTGANLKEKKGYVKEFIESEGLAMILSKDYGLVLFHLSSVWLQETQLDLQTTRKRLSPGMEVTFYDRSFKGEEYKDLSDDKVIHQAVAVWTGETRPDTVLRKITDEEYKKTLEEHRSTFMLYLRGEVFLRAAFVRVKGDVAGYINDKMGIIEYKDEKEKKINIFFHVDDVKLFKKDLREHGRPAKSILPVGSPVSVDARRVHVVGVKNVEYQAICVIAGSWPLTPHPTLMPGGQGSIAPAYEIPAGNYTFYYMELALEGRLTRKVQDLKDLLGKRGQIHYDWNNVEYIQSKEQLIQWRRQFGAYKRKANANFTPGQKREVLDVFKTSEAYEEDIKEENKSKITNKVLSERTWYTPSAWEHGGLRLKEEVKDEALDGIGAAAGEPLKKKPKAEPMSH
eukprot:TRINITY_DN3300_c0_g1_i1.p1 TRINITY_DN3300_c0_g1~~TRINITY_DN3300_c0_g1_i1.p1  ORF type:complete len:477 (+),score=163.52 TRINITY_DN3300_c0_g1_i1:61-1491(+)